MQSHQCKHQKELILTEEQVLQKTITSLNQIANPVIPNLSPFTVHLSTYKCKDRFIVELRKKWSVDLNNPKDNNKVFLKKLLDVSFSQYPLIAEIRIEYKDAFRQKLKLKQDGLL